MQKPVPVIAAVSLMIAFAAAMSCSPATEPLSPARPRRVPPTADRLARDKPYEAASFAVRKRTTGVITRGAVSDDMPPLPVARYQAALEKMRGMWSHSTEDGRIDRDDTALSKWREIGPSNIGGRTRQLLFDPRRDEIMYVAAVAGGVWKTKNGGLSWEQLTDLAIPNIAVNSLAIDPRHPDTLYAGTGEGYFNGDGVRGAGIFKTTDGGKRWRQLASTTGADFFRVNDIVISPRDSKRIYASTRTGVWRSANGGTTWTRVLDGSAIVGGCFDLAVQEGGAQGFVFATCGTFIYGPQSGIYRVLDDGGGGAWQQVYTEPDIGRISLAIAPSNQEIVYALAAQAFDLGDTYDDGLRAVFRSVNAGAPGTWTTQVRNTDANKLNTVLLTNPVFAFLADCGFGPQNFFFNQGWYDNVIAVDPRDPERVWAGGIDLFRSDDGGRNWGVASYWWFSGGVDGTPFDPNYAHADNHVIAFHPKFNGTTNKSLYVTSDGGIFRTADARANVGTTLANVCGEPAQDAVTWKSLNNNYAVTQFYHGAVYPDGDTFFGGTQDNGTIRGTMRTRDVWREIQGGDGGYVAVDPTNTDVLFAEFTGLSITRSRDGGATFEDATTGIDDPGFAFIAPFQMNPSRPEQLFSGGWYIWRTLNQADSWQRASAITPGAGSVSAIGVSTVDSNRAVVGMSDGYLLFNHAANTAGATTAWAFSRPRTGFVSSVHWDPVNVDVVYATYATFNTAAGQFHVYRSSDGGLTWSGLDGSGTHAIPDIPAHSIVVDPSNTARLYLGTDSGVFASIDGGLNWFKEATGYANVVTETLALSGDRRLQLYAFTHGRSAWRVRLRRDSDTDR
jgi:photosystem II stability/assembly factor-like uncharacterized protein